MDKYRYKWNVFSRDEFDGLPQKWNADMLTGTGGQFTSDPQANTVYYLAQPPVATAM